MKCEGGDHARALAFFQMSIPSGHQDQPPVELTIEQELKAAESTSVSELDMNVGLIALRCLHARMNERQFAGLSPI